MSSKQGRGDRGRGAQMYRGRTSQTIADKQRLKARKQARQKQAAQEKLRDTANRALRGLKLVLLAVILVVLFNIMQIKGHKFVGGSGLGEADIAQLEQLTDEYISGFRRFKPAFNASEYERHLIENTGFLAGADGDTSLLSSTVTVALKPKAATFHYEDPTQPNSGDLWVANDGSLISSTTVDAESVSLRLVNNTGVTYESGDGFISPSDAAYILELARSLDGAGAAIRSVYLGEAPRQFEASLVGENYRLLLSTERPIESVVVDFIEASETIRREKITVKNFVDLRVVDKVFYR